MLAFDSAPVRPPARPSPQLFAGPTRKAIRQGYKLPQVPRYLGSDDPSDFL